MTTLRIWLCVVACVCTVPEAMAWRGRPRGWGEVMAGWNTPAGHLGLAGGLRLSQWVRPTAAFGLGGQEGFNISVGNEFGQALNRKVLFMAWGYWTMGLGGRDEIADDHYYTIARSQMLKAGLSFALPVGRLDLDLGGGYSWFLERGSVAAYLPSGEEDLSASYADKLSNGFIVRVGIGVNMRTRRCGN